MPDLTGAPRELRGWKEIAEYLHVSVRKAQGLEKMRGLPVRRGLGPKPPVVASAPELDRWRADSDRGLRKTNQTGAFGPLKLIAKDQLPTQGRTETRPVSRRLILAGGAALLGGSGFAVTRLLKPCAPNIVRAGLVGNTLCAWDAAGHKVFAHPFSEAFDDTGRIGMLRDPQRQVQIANVYGDGSRQLLFAASFRDTGSVHRDELYCFAADGRLLWRYRPALTVTFGGEQFVGPWHLSDMLVAPTASGRRAIWLSLEHFNWRPGAVIALDALGQATLKFVNGGHVYALACVANPAGTSIIAGGVNNEYACAALAVLRDALPSRSPQTPGTRYECVHGPAGWPEHYLLLPPSELTLASGKPYDVVSWLEVVNRELLVGTSEVLGRDPRAIYRFSSSMEPRDVVFDDSWAAEHRRLQAEGKLPHAVRDCPQLRHPIELRDWRPSSGWRTITVPISSSIGPDAFGA